MSSKTPEQLANRAAYERHQVVVRASKKRAKAKETADYLAAHPEIQRAQNIANTRSWWGGTADAH